MKEVFGGVVSRLISEKINDSESVGSLSPKALSLFCLLIPKLNAYGKRNGNPYTIKGEVCPKVTWLTIKIIEESLKEISEKTDVKWFRDERGTFWIHAIKFDHHQPGLRKDRRGLDKIPNYPILNNSGSSPGELPEGSSPEGEGEEELEYENTPLPPEGECVSDFEKFWKAYPKRKSRGEAEKAWLALKPNEQLVVKILQGIERAKTSEDWRKNGGQFIPYPASWLRAKGWLDEVKSAFQPPPQARHQVQDLKPLSDEEYARGMAAKAAAQKELGWRSV